MGHFVDPAQRRGIGRVALVLAFTVHALSASELQGPSLGALFDSASGQLYPIVGIPAAAAIGKPLEVGQLLSSASVCSARGFALAISRDGGQVLVVSFGKGIIETGALAGAPPGPDRMVLSPNCTSAALLYSAVSQGQLITGLPDHPSLSPIVLSPLPSLSGAIAVDDTGASLLVATSIEGTSIVNRLSASAQPGMVAIAGSVSAIAFLRNSPDAVVAANSGSNQLYLLRDAASGALAPSQIGGRPDRSGDAVSVTTSAENRYVYVANARTDSVTIVDLRNESTQELSCSSKVEGINALRNGFTFLLSARTDRPMTILDVSGAQPRLSLIPAASALANGSAQ